MVSLGKRTSSLFDCFWRLWLRAEGGAPTSLAGAFSTGRGMLEPPGLPVKGIVPRPCRLGVPLIVPDMVSSKEGG